MGCLVDGGWSARDYGWWSTGRLQRASASLAASSSVPEEMLPEESDHVVEGGLFFWDSAVIPDAHVPHSVADEECHVATVPASASGGSDCIRRDQFPGSRE